MKFRFRIFLLLLMLTGTACNPFKKTYPESFQCRIINTMSMQRKDAAVSFCVDTLKKSHPDFNPEAYVVFSEGKEIPSQTIDQNNDGTPDKILAVHDLSGNDSIMIAIRYAVDGQRKNVYPKRTQAELSHKTGGKWVGHIYEGGTFRNIQRLRVPPEHTDHSLFIRYEGPGWESDKVGYRFYLDWRNAIDIYGKKIPDMVLQNVGQDGFESYHEMSDWGMDILKVGESLGLGSIGMWIDNRAERVSVTDSIVCAIVENGPLYSQIQTRYYGWKTGFLSYNLTSDLSIMAGSRITKHDIRISGDPPNLCTGIVKHDSTEVFQMAGEAWSAFATWGKQSLAEDKLGMAVVFHRDNMIQITEDEYSHVIVLRPKSGRLTYYFLAAWEKEPEGIQSKDTFTEFLENTLIKLDNPLMISDE